MADHKHGEMNMDVQEKTYAGFIAFTKWSVIAILGALVVLALVGA